MSEAAWESYKREYHDHVPGTIYLLHFNPPYQHARHYLGWTASDPADRLLVHLNGWGSPLVRAVVQSGGVASIVRMWEGVDRHDERRLKDRHDVPNLCPSCTVRPRDPELLRCARD